ncbi:hypothetical protein TIFTF001_025149 [Ficus carica]|uniref:Uncharacterized protein n=1 Tax=Ficus carica TaxID=3494 RepID=A0AA88DDX5_FICCA|nr:hypothetical protein TIFTF001_025149 [Ficus carica]
MTSNITQELKRTWCPNLAKRPVEGEEEQGRIKLRGDRVLELVWPEIFEQFGDRTSRQGRLKILDPISQGRPAIGEGKRGSKEPSQILDLKYSMQQCPGRIKLDIGHHEHKQGKYNSAYSIGFVVYTCLRLNAMICYKVCNVMCYNMLGYVVNNLLATDDARWKGEAWRTVK